MIGEAHAELDLFVVAALDDVDRPRCVVVITTRDERGDLFERMHGGRQRDALKIARATRETFERRHQHRAAPVVGDGVNLIENHRLHCGQRVRGRAVSSAATQDSPAS